LAERLEPCTVVEFGVVLLDLALGVNDHVVDAIDGVRKGNDAPSPGDTASVVPDVERVDGDFRLQDTLTVVEGGFAGEGYGTELTHKHQ